MTASCMENALAPAVARPSRSRHGTFVRFARPPLPVTLRLRLALGLAAVAVLLAAPLVLALRALRDARTAASLLRGQEVAAALVIGRSREITSEVRTAEDAVLFVPNDPASAERMRRAVRALVAVGDTLNRYQLEREGATLRDAAHRLAEAAPLQIAAARAGRDSVADLISAERIGPAVRDAQRALDAAEVAVRSSAEQRARHVVDDANVALTQAILLLAAGAAGAVAVSVWLTRSISEPVRDLARGMEAVAAGRFDHALRLTPSRRDEFGGLAADFATMTRRLAELDRLRHEFVSVASHELKTPLNVILGYVSLVGEGLYGPVTPEQRGVLRTVEGQAHHLTRLVQRLLDVSRFRAGGGSGIDVRPLPLRPFLADLERAHRVLAEQRGLTLSVRADDPELPETVTWDADRMAEVLGNLVSNAVKFTPAGGRVTLHVEPAPDYATDALPEATRHAPALRLAVEDTGVGIPPEQLPHVFDKFYQASNQSRASAVGSGLGLAITKQIVEAHGGMIGVESTPDVGTRFVILVPADVTPAPADPPGPDAPGGGREVGRLAAGAPEGESAGPDDPPVSQPLERAGTGGGAA